MVKAIHNHKNYIPINRFVTSTTDGEGVMFIIQQLVSINRVFVTCLQDPTGLARERGSLRKKRGGERGVQC